MKQLINNAWAICLALLFLPAVAQAAGETELTPAMVNPGHEEQPDWFKVSFLDLYEDIAEAADENRRLMVSSRTAVPIARNCWKTTSASARSPTRHANISMWSR